MTGPGREKGKWPARFLAVGLGIGLLAAAELVLRFFGAPEQGRDQAWTAIHPYRVVGGMAETRPEFRGVLRQERFPAQKPEGTYRVFAIGGSTTFGYPFDASVAWPKRLLARLETLHPDRSFEVLNAGGTSYGSSRALGVLRGLVRYEPDLVVFCGGDAEFVEDSYRVAAAPRGPGGAALRSLYLSRYLLKVLPRTGSRPTVDATDEGAAGFLFSPTVHGTVYRPTEERRREVLTRYRDNLTLMADLAQREEFGLIFCTLPSNTSTWPPDPDAGGPSDPGERVRWQHLVDRGRALHTAGDAAGAAAVLEEAAALWGDNATLRFELGRALLAQGRAEEAVGHLERARDLDPSPVRAGSRFNATLREVARARNLGLVDGEEAFVRAAGGGPVGEDLVLDYAHPTALGQALLARTVWRGLARRGAPWSAVSRADEERLWAAEQAAAKAEPVLDANTAFVWGQIYLRKGQPARAARLFRDAMGRGYDLPYAPLNLAAALLELGDLPGARRELERLVSEQPGFVEPYPLLAEVLARAGDPVGAIRNYRLALRHGARERDVFLSLATHLLEGGDPSGALAVLDEAVDHFPNDCALDALRGRALEWRGGGREAAEVYREAIQRDPGCHVARENLGILLMNAGDWTAAERVFRDSTAATGSAFPVDHLNLGIIYSVGLGDHAAALEQFRVYAKLEPENVDRIPPEFRNRVGSGSAPAGEAR